MIVPLLNILMNEDNEFDVDDKIHNTLLFMPIKD